MACAHPITITHDGINFKVPCRQCLPCRISYQNQLEFACCAELYTQYMRGFGATFNCLTYDDEHLPPNGSLCKRDLQLFIKRLRSNINYRSNLYNFKYIACGEYGDMFGRAHYHLIVMGLTDVQFNKFGKDAWGKGLIDVQPLGTGGLRYVLKYCCKQLVGKLGDELYTNNGLEKPFLLRSKRMGYDWINDNIGNIVDNNYSYNRNGKVVPIPKYYRNLLDKNKTYDNLDIVISIKRSAESLGMSLDKYNRYTSLAMESTLITKMREAGNAVDDSQYIMDCNLVGGLGFNFENILDPLPF